MKLTFNSELADGYKSQPQQIRVLTEDWVGREVYCPNCGSLRINGYENNKPVADFFCINCREDYELKSKRDTIGDKIVDGAYKTMISRLQGENNPNFFLLSYDLVSHRVLNFLIIPKHFFTPDIIEKRKPLAQTARRAGWVGCNILLKNIPRSGKIFYIRDGIVEPKDKVISSWKDTLFLKKKKPQEGKGWLLDVMRCIEKLESRNFTLDDLYKFEGELNIKYPDNRHVKDKIRQQLQVLRDSGYLTFVSKGKYQIAVSDTNFRSS